MDCTNTETDTDSQSTYFASPERADEEELTEQIEIVSNNKVMSGLLHTVSGLLAVLNEHRQILTVNNAFLKTIGVNDPGTALGLRPGEALDCVYANEEPAGCGTTKFCSTCGAAVAMVASLSQNACVERICVLTAKKPEGTIDLTLSIRSQPIVINEKKFLLLFIQDISRQQQQAALERTFFHDINNMLHALVGASDLLCDTDSSELATIIQTSSLRLMKEISVQRYLMEEASTELKPDLQKVSIGEILKELRMFFANHPQGKKRRLIIQDDYPEVVLTTDSSLLLRILYNMTLNALEASEEDGTVKIRTDFGGGRITFHVWNKKKIPPEIARRIFQRNFSTKEQIGRGIGTFSMKLFGEKVLGGKVTFSTSDEGTVFRYCLPVE